MLKRYLLITAVFALLAGTFESCKLFKKNQCDTCPGLTKTKKVRKSSKGSI